MNILHIISSSGFYGAEVMVLNLMNALKNNGLEPWLACLRSSSKPDPAIHRRAAEHGIDSKVFKCNRKLDLKTIQRLKQYIACQKIDLVHTHNFKSDFYGFLAAGLSGVPVIATIHGWTAEDTKVQFYEMTDRRLLRFMSHIVAVSPLIYDELRELKLNDSKISFIPNAIDTSYFDPDCSAENIREEFGLTDSLVLGAVGRLSPEKGHMDLLNAFEKACKNTVNVKLFIVGAGKLDGELKKHTEDLGIADKVVFAGERKDMLSVYKSMDIFVLPSLTEGIPVALLEAMSMALPNIATRVGGVPYVLENDEALLVPAGNITEMANSIQSMVEDSSLRECLGGRARTKAVTTFSVDTSRERYADIYKDLVKRK